MGERITAGPLGIYFFVVLSEVEASVTLFGGADEPQESDRSLDCARNDKKGRPLLLVRHHFYISEFDRLAVEIVFGR